MTLMEKKQNKFDIKLPKNFDNCVERKTLGVYSNFGLTLKLNRLIYMYIIFLNLLKLSI